MSRQAIKVKKKVSKMLGVLGLSSVGISVQRYCSVLGEDQYNVFVYLTGDSVISSIASTSYKEAMQELKEKAESFVNKLNLGGDVCQNV